MVGISIHDPWGFIHCRILSSCPLSVSVLRRSLAGAIGGKPLPENPPVGGFHEWLTTRIQTQSLDRINKMVGISIYDPWGFIHCRILSSCPLSVSVRRRSIAGAIGRKRLKPRRDRAVMRGAPRSASMQVGGPLSHDFTYAPTRRRLAASLV